MKKKHLRAMALAMAALMSLTACGGGSSTSSEAGSTTAGAADTTAADTTAAAVADPNATYKATLHIAVSQQAPSLDLHKNSTLIARQMCDGTVFEKLVTLNAKAEADEAAEVPVPFPERAVGFAPAAAVRWLEVPVFPAPEDFAERLAACAAEAR